MESTMLRHEHSNDPLPEALEEGAPGLEQVQKKTTFVSWLRALAAASALFIVEGAKHDAHATEGTEQAQAPRANAAQVFQELSTLGKRGRETKVEGPELLFHEAMMGEGFDPEMTKMSDVTKIKLHQTLVKFLDHDVRSVKEYAAWWAGVHKVREAVPKLYDFLDTEKNSNKTLQKYAAESMARLSPDCALAANIYFKDCMPNSNFTPEERIKWSEFGKYPKNKEAQKIDAVLDVLWKNNAADMALRSAAAQAKLVRGSGKIEELDFVFERLSDVEIKVGQFGRLEKWSAKSCDEAGKYFQLRSQNLSPDMLKKLALIHAKAPTGWERMNAGAALTCNEDTAPEIIDALTVLMNDPEPRTRVFVTMRVFQSKKHRDLLLPQICQMLPQLPPHAQQMIVLELSNHPDQSVQQAIEPYRKIAAPKEKK